MTVHRSIYRGREGKESVLDENTDTMHLAGYEENLISGGSTLTGV